MANENGDFYYIDANGRRIIIGNRNNVNKFLNLKFQSRFFYIFKMLLLIKRIKSIFLPKNYKYYKSLIF